MLNTIRKETDGIRMKRNGWYPYKKETDGIRINTNAIFGWNPNTRDKKYMILIMSKKLTKLSECANHLIHFWIELHNVEDVS